MTTLELLTDETDAALSSENVGDDGAPTISDLEIRLRLSSQLVSDGHELNSLAALIERLTGKQAAQREWIAEMRAAGIQHLTESN